MSKIRVDRGLQVGGGAVVGGSERVGETGWGRQERKRKEGI